MKGYTRKELKQLDQSVRLQIKSVREEIRAGVGGSEEFIDALCAKRDALVKQHKQLCALLRKGR